MGTERRLFRSDCWMDGREMDVWYDVQATWKLTETDILWEVCRLRYRPLSKAENMRSGNGKILICLNIPYSLSNMLLKWRTVMRSNQLFYAGDGNLLQKRDVSGNKDDTHWPIDELKTGR